MIMTGIMNLKNIIPVCRLELGLAKRNDPDWNQNLSWCPRSNLFPIPKTGLIQHYSKSNQLHCFKNINKYWSSMCTKFEGGRVLQQTINPMLLYHHIVRNYFTLLYIYKEGERKKCQKL